MSFKHFLFDQVPNEISNEKGQFNFVTKQLVVMLKKILSVGWGRMDYGKFRNEFIAIKRNTIETNLLNILKVVHFSFF